jgi:hypothetical protein
MGAVERVQLHISLSYFVSRLTKCTFHKFGASGELEKHDALCILPLNIFNEKIYIFLWFWMLSLTALTSIVVFYRSQKALMKYCRELLKQKPNFREGNVDISAPLVNYFWDCDKYLRKNWAKKAFNNFWLCPEI